jgi:hypothetical protein
MDIFLVMVALAVAVLFVFRLIELQIDAAFDEVAHYRARLIDEMARYDDAAREGRISAKD